MTTKIKIIAGFTLMIILMTTMAIVNYRGIQRSAEGFSTYQSLARLDVSLSDLGTALEEIGSNLFEFLATGQKNSLAEARQAIAKAENEIKNAEIAVTGDRKARLNQLLTEAQSLNQMLRSVEQDADQFAGLFTSVVLKGEKSMMDGVSELAVQAMSMDNSLVLNDIIRFLQDYAVASSAMSRYFRSRSLEDSKAVQNALVMMKKELDSVGEDLRTASGKAIFNNLQQGFTGLEKAFVTMNTEARNVQQNVDNITKRINTMLQNITSLNSEATEARRQNGGEMQANNQALITSTLTIGGVGLLLGIGIALFIVFGIVRVLQELSHFAAAISQGSFSHQIKIKEKGEVGTVIGSLMEIPSVLRQIIQQANTLAGDIVVGRLRNRLDASKFSGEYANLAVSINTVGNAYTDVIDFLPVPVMACDKSLSVTFFNKAGQSVVGGNRIDSPCRDHLNADACKGEKCFGKKAMEKNAPVNGETTIYPQGKKMEVSVSAIPLRDLSGQTAGYFEIITDLTAIKEQQNTMMQVARDASDIANRVAAASEQLASQVEQISRGAEIQRTRVESTASAMTEMNATVLEVARSAGQASEQSEKTKEKADDGAGLVNQVVNSINSVNRVAVTLQNNMQELGTQAESIGGVMNVISDIADQTNLLALNAAIEAARAGEAGRGFAVVADEVRKLAEKTMSATHEVGSSIKAIQQSTRVNIDEVGNAVKSITEATGLANSSGSALGEIVELASANSAVVASIATAAEEQSATSEEINRAIDEINSIVGETTEGMLQSSAAVQDLSRMAQELNRTMEALK